MMFVLKWSYVHITRYCVNCGNLFINRSYYTHTGVFIHPDHGLDGSFDCCLGCNGVIADYAEMDYMDDEEEYWIEEDYEVVDWFGDEEEE